MQSSASSRSFHGDIPLETSCRHSSKHGQVGHFTRSNLPGRNVETLEKFHGFHGKRRRKKREADVATMFGKSRPLFAGKLHPLPIVVASGVLGRKPDAKRFGRRRLGRGNMRLEFDCVRTAASHGVDVRVGRAETPVVRLRHFGDDVARLIGADLAPGQLEAAGKIE
jgi:hypothetical protein